MDRDPARSPRPAPKTLAAVCGKGGTGKTAFTAMMARALLEGHRAGRLLLIDADPAQGLTNAEIAERLFLTRGTVRNYVSAILAKLGVEDRTQAALLAVNYGLLEPPKP